VVPATLPPGQSTMINVAAEIPRAQGTVRQSCALLRSRSRAAPLSEPVGAAILHLYD
jgi:hypothetical protein